MDKEYNKLDKTFNITPEVVEEKSEVIKPEKPDRLTKDDITTLDQIKNVVLRKGMDSSVVPNEIKEEIQQTVPSILSRKQ